MRFLNALFRHSPLRQRRNPGVFARAIAVGLALVAVLAFAAAARADSEIVLAIRYLTATGTSHAHLYLYREDGKLLRQLTKDDSGQDRNPQFAPDGETIVFTRTKPKALPEYWTVQPRGGGLSRLAAAPAWYSAGDTSPYFTVTETSSAADTATPRPTYRSPDGAVEIVLSVRADDPDKDISEPGHGSHYVLRDLKSGHETELGKLPGFLGLYETLHNSQNPDQRFLFDNTLRVFFFGLHLDSTDGGTIYALDLNHPRLVQLSPNWAVPYPLSGEAAFLTDAEVRFVPIPGSRKTANSSYVEHWDASLHKLRYAHTGAAITYGASMYRPGRTPAIVTIHSAKGD